MLPSATKRPWPFALILLFSLWLVGWPLYTLAQETPPPVPTVPAQVVVPLVHTVQEGENLTIIATQYNVSVEDLLAINNLSNADMLALGQQLIIPGAEGEAVPTQYVVQAGDSLAHIAALFKTDVAALLATNRWPNPMYQPPIGQRLTAVSHTGSTNPEPLTGTPHLVRHGDSLLTIAARYGRQPAEIAALNQLDYPYYLIPGQRLRIPSDDPYQALPGDWLQVQVRPLTARQGSTVSIFVRNKLDGTPSGSFAGQPLHFFPYQDGFVALAGIDAFTEPGMGLLQLAGSGSQPWDAFSQPMPIASAGFGVQSIVVGEELSALLEPQIRQNEDEMLATIYNQSQPEPAWSDLFQYPVTSTIVTAGYGDGRSYNGGPIEIYHTGVDFAGGIGTPILAPANGTVRFADMLELRGYTVILDHGLGIMTAYFHLSEMFVAVGDTVTTGQTIGVGGSTGLSTGPHLHWDVRINGVPVNGLQWTEVAFP